MPPGVTAKQAKKKLTNKQRAFCREYMIDLNATQAAKRAGYSKKTAYSMGQRLLKNVEIQKFLKKLQNKQEKRASMNADEIIERLERIARKTPKVRDKIKAMELLGKRFGIFPNKNEVTGKECEPIKLQVVNFANIDDSK